MGYFKGGTTNTILPCKIATPKEILGFSKNFQTGFGVLSSREGVIK